MRYLVLRKRPDAGDNPFTEMVAAGGAGGGFELPFEASSEDLRDKDAGDLLRDPNVEHLVLSIPFTLIEPLDEPSGGPMAPTAWGVEAVGASTSSQNGEGVTVAVLDTGIDKDHPAFAGITFHPEDLMDFTVNEDGVAGSAPDEQGHGTHAAGTIFGREVNGTRIGIAPGVKRVLIGKVLGPTGGPTEAVYNAVDWALRRHADVISMSLGMDFPGLMTRLVHVEGFPEDIAFSRALEAFRSNVRLFDRLAALVAARVDSGRGALLVAASGNQSRRSQDPRFTVATAPPAAADGFISVGAVSKTGDASSPFTVASFSNTGCLLAAPGVSILSASVGGGLMSKSGTSMAAPHVAGVIALWTQKRFPQQERPQGWAREVQRDVESHVVAVPGQTRNDVGLGVVQAPR
ncbi:MAG TPA: S8 family serine peptidase [Thermoanaerobaculia bacterium]|nr:S8 family serine peptidase [Thermoanaerobaculia bacterium]